MPITAEEERPFFFFFLVELELGSFRCGSLPVLVPSVPSSAGSPVGSMRKVEVEVMVWVVALRAVIVMMEVVETVALAPATL